MKIGVALILMLAWAMPAGAEVFRVDRVINGHTFKLSNDKIVRLIGIDASDPTSTEFVRQLVEGRGVKLEFDEVREDDEGHWLAYVLMIETFLNASIVYAGYAVPESMPPNTMHDEMFQALYENARANHRGLWK